MVRKTWVQDPSMGLLSHVQGTVAMKLLRETIRSIILKEGMMTHNDLPDNVCLSCYKDRGDRWWIEYCLFEDGQHGMALTTDGEFTDGTIVYDSEEEPIWGYISFEPVERGRRGNCLGAMKVSSVKAASGWGPLLYDCAMEWATQEAGGLIPDRVAVSDDARGVWDYYMNHRDDVKFVQLDNMQDSFENGPADDCDQSVASILWKGDNMTFDGDWKSSALSKVYMKEPTTIDALGNKWEVLI